MPDTAFRLLNTKRVDQSFDKHQPRIFTPSEIERFVNEEKESWLIPDTDHHKAARLLSAGKASQVRSLATQDILDCLVNRRLLREVKMPFPYRAVRRFTWGDVPFFQVVQSVDPNAYFSHFTAMHFHGLTEQIPKTVYLNVEQAASGGGGTLTQEGINRAFKGKCRVSSNVCEYLGRKIHRINGKNTAHLGVVTFRPDHETYELRVTNIERTLIDATVRPVYAGGVAEVAKAFKSAADRVSVNKIAAYLRQMRYTYPYHQAIGYYLDRAAVYTEDQLRLMTAFGITFDFYLAYGMKNPDYNEKWRLFIPKGF